MQCSVLKGPLVSGVRQLWPRRNHLTRTARWGTSRQVSSTGLQRESHRNGFSENRNHVSGTGEETRWRVSALDRSQTATNGESFRGPLTPPEEELKSEPLDAILVLAGGQLRGGGVPVWVERRLDTALQLQKLNGPSCSIVCLGNGTPHRRPILTPEGFVVHESSSCAQYLINKGAPVSILLKEWGSYDTIGNPTLSLNPSSLISCELWFYTFTYCDNFVFFFLAGNGFFALTQHVIPRRWRRMAVVTSDFHMPRSHAIFEWVFGLQGAGTSIRQANGAVSGVVSSTGSRSQGFLLQYHGVSDIGIDTSIIQVLFRNVSPLRMEL
jgi:hypothetical protein